MGLKEAKVGNGDGGNTCARQLCSLSFLSITGDFYRVFSFLFIDDTLYATRGASTSRFCVCSTAGVFFPIPVCSPQIGEYSHLTTDSSTGRRGKESGCRADER